MCDYGGITLSWIKWLILILVNFVFLILGREDKTLQDLKIGSYRNFYIEIKKDGEVF